MSLSEQFREFTSGLLIGACFYGGLWWTVRRIRARGAVFLLLGSFLARAALALAAFYAVAGSSAYAFGLCMAGFLLARILVERLGRPQSKPDVCTAGTAP